MPHRAHGHAGRPAAGAGPGRFPAGACLRAAEEKYAPGALSVDTLDGLSVEFADWRFNLRKSNTEPLVRLNVEARGSADLVRAKARELNAFIEGVRG